MILFGTGSLDWKKFERSLSSITSITSESTYIIHTSHIKNFSDKKTGISTDCYKTYPFT